MRRTLRWTFAALAAALSPTSSAGTLTTLTDIGLLPSTSVPTIAVSGVSADGEIVIGYAGYDTVGARVLNMPFRWTAEGGFEELATRADRLSHLATDNSSVGDVVVGYENTNVVNNGGRLFPYLWTETGGLVDLGVPHVAAQRAITTGVSDDGSQVVGYYSRGGRRVPFYWKEAEGYVPAPLDDSFLDPVQITGISGDGTTLVYQAVVQTLEGLAIKTFHWTEDAGFVDIGDLPGGITAASARDVSEDGTVIVGGSETDNGTEAFRWTSDGGIQPLGDLPGGEIDSLATDVSSNGRYVVGVSDTGGDQHEPFIWDEVHGMRSLSVLLEQQGVDTSDWSFFEADGVSDDGLTVVGEAYRYSLNRAVGFVASLQPTAIPEPGSAVLLALGAGAASLRRSQPTR